MNQALWVAKTGLDAQQTRMAVVSNNLANVNTTGFKQDRAVFEDLLYQNVRQSGGQSSQDTQLPSGMNIGTGVRIVATEKLFTQGSMLNTENSLDVAIKGRGFFQVLLPDGNLAYTRDGTFQRNAQGELVTASGYLVQPSITVPDGRMVLSQYSSPASQHHRRLVLWRRSISSMPQVYSRWVKTSTSRPLLAVPPKQERQD